MERRIAAVVAADMAGYARLMERDEVGVIERQRRHMHELIKPKFDEFNGRIIKLTGDGLLAEFSSAVEAVQCCLAVQKEMAVREADQPADRRIQYRIGITLGDIVEDEQDVYGDGVNIAARLEGLAKPGGLVISGTVHDILKKQIDVDYLSLGEKRLKNILTPVRVYRVVEGAGRSLSTYRPRLRRQVRIAGFAVLIAAAVAAGWIATRPDFAPADPAKLSFEIPQKPSIAIAPFRDLNGAEDRAWLSEGLAQNIVAALAISPDMLVISANSVSSMKGQEPARIAERFGVRYVLLGSLQSEGERLRIGAQLVDTTTGRTLWANQWDRSNETLMTLQDEVASAVFEELQVKLTVGEQARTWRQFLTTPEDLRDVFQGRAAFRQFDAEGHARATTAWRRFHERNPDNAFGYLLMGNLSWQKIPLGISTDIVGDFRQAMDYANKSIELGGDGSMHVFRANLLLAAQQHDKAVAEAERALQMNPGDAYVVLLSGYILSRSGRAEQGIDLMERGMRLEPVFPDWAIMGLSEAYAQAGRFDRVREISQQVLGSDTENARAKPHAHLMLAAVSVWDGEMDEARAHIADLKRASPSASLASVAAARKRFSNRAYVDRLMEALKAAGLE